MISKEEMRANLQKRRSLKEGDFEIGDLVCYKFSFGNSQDHGIVVDIRTCDVDMGKGIYIKAKQFKIHWVFTSFSPVSLEEWHDATMFERCQ